MLIKHEDSADQYAILVGSLYEQSFYVGFEIFFAKNGLDDL